MSMQYLITAEPRHSLLLTNIERRVYKQSWLIRTEEGTSVDPNPVQTRR